MNAFGLHSFAIAPAWDLARIEPRMDRLKELGVGLIEVPLHDPRDIDTRRTRGFAAHYGVDLVASLDLPRALDIVERADDALDFLQPAFEACNEVGSEALVGLTCGTAGGIAGKGPAQKEIDGLCRFLEKAAKSARTRSLKLGIEPRNRYETHLLNRSIDAAQIIERIGAENIFIHLDTFHMHMEEESFASGFEAAAPFLGYVNVSEANRGAPGRGMLDWAACMKAIADIGYAGTVTLKSANLADADAVRGVASRRSREEDPRQAVEAGLAFVREEACKAGLTLG